MSASKKISRRRFFGVSTAALALAAGRSRGAEAEKMIELPMAHGARPLVAYPQKRPLIRLTTRPPQLETPFEVFNGGVLTPNDAFFVRYHLSNAPPEIDPERFRLLVRGEVSQELSLSLEELRSQFEPVEIVAVNQCSGNSRGFFQPRVGGGQLGNGAMGNARWKGAPLAAILKKAGVKSGARQATFQGLDRPAIEKTPAFIKALEIDHALDGEVMVAYEMNGEPLPMLNGFPVRLVTPGYYGTYWVKHLNEVTVVSKEFEGFWMNPAYRIPANACACVEPGKPAGKTVPIARYNVRSFITSLQDGSTVKAGAIQSVKGIAFDGGYGIREVVFSSDGGKTWSEAELGQSLGPYSFREWRIDYRPMKAGEDVLKVRATNRIGQSQPLEPLWNPSGYMRNVVETVRVRVEG